jgi:HAE1 family hydrophobic/amphiphilic exporter-1
LSAAKGLLAAALAAFAAGRAAAADPAPLVLTLDDAVRIALDRNIDAERARYNLAIVESQYRQAFGTALPALTLSGNYTHNFEPPLAFFGGQKLIAGQPNALQGEASVAQALYSGGKVTAALRGGAAAREEGRADLAQTRDDVTLTVKQLFYSVLLASATASIQQDNLASAEEHMRTISERYKMGLDSDLNVLRQQVEVANAKPALIAARNQVELGLTMLKDALALDVDRPVVLAGELGAPNGMPSYEKAAEVALARRPEVAAAHQRALVAQETINLDAADGRPQLSLFGNIQWNGQGQSLNLGPNERGTSSAAGLNMTFPVFTGGQVHERVAQARLAYEKILEEEAQTRRDVLVDVKRQWLGAEEALERAESEETAIGQGRRALDSTEVRYKAGRASQLDLIDTTLALNRTRTNYVQALNDYWTSLAALERAAGVSLKEMTP